MLSRSQTRTVLDTLALSLAGVGEQVPDEVAERLARAAGQLSVEAADEPHPALPAVGACLTQQRTVSQEDTAAAMGHPDPAVAVLGSPRLALWFELGASALLPAPDEARSHVGVGIVVHHVDRAEVGQRVAVRAVVSSTHGRHALFVCSAHAGDRLVAVGSHHRVLLDRA